MTKLRSQDKNRKLDKTNNVFTFPLINMAKGSKVKVESIAVVPALFVHMKYRKRD